MDQRKARLKSLLYLVIAGGLSGGAIPATANSPVCGHCIAGGPGASACANGCSVTCSAGYACCGLVNDVAECHCCT